ncbi:VRR-NUC domain-containing protein [Polaribacter batillariae]|uniref:VRR-NUC domain-containing protein n=1 Tax=Polaribacter batillariae TaxID=2808900 RepID=A0ABX7SU35_9FLAO|nr:VRR-NUC domain-containing protein [Polaribacter batillariae]QTD36343.1 VRR-NUC domain-containing protein [Polaribacter batillariae]
MNEILNGIEIKKTFQLIPVWKGKEILDTYGKKPVLNYNGIPLFAELYALRKYKEKGFEGVWADTFRNKFRSELPEKNEPKIILPEFISEKLNKINANGKLSGTWDLILWKQNEIKFVELKRKGKDKIRKTQIEFLERAIKNGISVESFEIYEWKENE